MGDFGEYPLKWRPWISWYSIPVMIRRICKRGPLWNNGEMLRAGNFREVMIYGVDGQSSWFRIWCLTGSYSLPLSLTCRRLFFAFVYGCILSWAEDHITEAQMYPPLSGSGGRFSISEGVIISRWNPEERTLPARLQSVASSAPCKQSRSAAPI